MPECGGAAGAQQTSEPLCLIGNGAWQGDRPRIAPALLLTYTICVEPDTRSPNMLMVLIISVVNMVVIGLDSGALG